MIDKEGASDMFFFNLLQVDFKQIEETYWAKALQTGSVKESNCKSQTKRTEVIIMKGEKKEKGKRKAS